MEELLRSGTDVRIRATGRSMAPALEGGEIVTIRPTEFHAVKRGDIVLFVDDSGHPVLHRVLCRKVLTDGSCRFTTKGDALASCDSEVGPERLLGRVVRVEKISDSGKPVDVDTESTRSRCRSCLTAAAGLLRLRTCRLLSRIAAAIT